MARTTEFVLLLGLEQYSGAFFRQVEAEIRREVPEFRLQLFEDHDTQRRPAELEAAIARSACLFTALMTLADYAEWLVDTVERLDPPLVFAFEGLPEVHRLTKVGSYSMHNAKGMPKPVQRVAQLLVGGREEDTYYGYVKLQKVTGRLINLIPGKRMADLRNWTNVSMYWTHRNLANVVNMFKLILREYCGYSRLHVDPPAEVPTMGFAHPDAPKFFSSPEEYDRWERARKPAGGRSKPGRKTGNDGLVNTVLEHLHLRPQHAASGPGTVAVMSFRSHLLAGATYHYEIVRALEAAGLRVLPIFCMGIENHVAVRQWLQHLQVDLVINTMGFPLVGGPAGSIKAGLTTARARELLEKLDVPYIVAQPLFIQDLADWQQQGVSPIQTTILYNLPEMDGAIAPVVLGGMQAGSITVLPDRLARLSALATNFARLRRKTNAEKKVAVVVYNYPPGTGHTATAALLDVPRSLVALLNRLRAAGYQVGEFPQDPAVMARCISGSISREEHDLPAGHPPLPAPLTVRREQYRGWLSPAQQERIDARWGRFPGDMAPAGLENVFLGGMQLGNVYLGVQPPIGMPGDPMRLLFDRENSPHHQYAAFYRWLSRDFGADAVIHVGMHGTAEWMPGLQLGLSHDCWPDMLLGEVPHFYLYPINNPAEANIAKRRGFATIVGHAIPPYGRAGLYKELQALKDLLEEYRSRRSRAVGAADEPEQHDEQAAILNKIDLLNLEADLSRHEGENFAEFASRVYAYLRELENSMIVDSLHVLGSAPPPEQQLTLLVEALKIGRGGRPGLADLLMGLLPDLPESGYADLLGKARRGEAAALAARECVDAACNQFVEQAMLAEQPLDAALHAAVGEKPAAPEGLTEILEHGRAMLAALRDNTRELDFLLHGLEGGYIPAGPGGDIIRDGVAVLPTGRNIHALDPFRVPTEAAYQRGLRVAEALIAAHRAEHNGEYPEAIAQVLWGLDSIKTRGEAIAVILGLIGARPQHDGQGKIARFALIPLAELGRPRIDVLMTASGIFRDAFAGTMDLLDRLVREAAAADEPEEQNFLRKHVNALLAEGHDFESATARIFTQAAGTYGTDVDEAIEGGAWEERRELEDLFVKRNAYAFGGKKGGAAQPEVLNRLLGSVGRVAQEIDSVEYGLTDLQHYYGYSGALKAAAERRSGQEVKLSYVESFTSETKVQDLDQVLRMEYRTKLLNPKWYEGMLRHGHNGAAEIAGRFTYMLGWSATTGAVDNWVYSRAAETFILDEEMRKRLEAANPEAARSAVGRLLEASSRGLWQADEGVLDQLRELYADLEDRLEGVA